MYNSLKHVCMVPQV